MSQRARRAWTADSPATAPGGPAHAAALLLESARLKLQLATTARPIADAARCVAETIRGGGKVLIFGNGGSAADAQHFAAELTGRFERERAAWPAIALTTDSSALTAIGNDYGFEHVFARQVEALGRPGDTVVAISTSGRSANVLRAVDAARRLGLRVVALTGAGGPLQARADVAISVPSTAAARVQEAHIAVAHVIVALVERALLGVASAAAAPNPPPRVVEWPMLQALREGWRAAERTVVWTNGCFDLLHAGHVRSLQAARALGSVLIVGVNDDRTVRALKGDGRPIVPQADRLALVAALACVDHAVLLEEPTPEAALWRLRPDVHCKGADYAPPHGKPMPEAALVRAYGGRIEFLPLLEGRSTTSLVARTRAADAPPTEHDDG